MPARVIKKEYDHLAIATMFKVSGRNQLQLITIADNKANMMTAICVSLIFLIIILFSSGFSMGGSAVIERVEVVVPLGILLALCCVSAVCSILALKPKIIRGDKEGRSALFFRNYYKKTLEEYKKNMLEVMNSGETVYDQMLTDMYHNGLVLERKYALLSYAYSIFLLAIVLSVSSYVITTVM